MEWNAPYCRALPALVGILGFLASAVAQAAVGITPASHGVSQSGSAEYSIPIRVTPGIGALTPSLAVNWAGAGRRGILGVGFDLAGLSQIRRCNRNIAQDGQSNGFAYCLDGARLRSVSGNYGAQNTVYRTEIDQLARITQMGSLPGGYPEWFKVETRDGLVYEYGRTADARPLTNEYYPAPIHWAVNKIVDRSGNSITFHYETDGPQSRFRPSYIQYTHTGAASGRYKIGFVYQASARSDVVDQAVSVDPILGRNVEDRLLARIELKHDDAVYRQYVFAYETGAGSNSRLKTFQECAATTSDCLSATTLGWQSATSGHAAPTSVTIGTNPLPLDLNGDGRDDIVYVTSGTWRYRLGGASGYGAEVNTAVTATNPAKALPLDWDGDAFTDLLIDNADGKWRVLRGTATGFAAAVHAGPGAGIPSNTSTSSWYVADVDGDGRDDLLRAINSGVARMYARLNGSGGFGAEADAFPPGHTMEPDPEIFQIYWKFVGNPFPATADYGSSAIRQADVNGDGMTDLVVWACSWDDASNSCALTGWFVLLSYGQGYEFAWNLPGATTNVVPRQGDFNGDGRTDFAYASTAQAKWCFAFSYTSGPLTSCGPSTSGYATFPFMTGDHDDDGYDDLFVAKTATNTWEVIRSTGPAIATTTIATGLASTGSGWTSSDFTGDGLDDLTKSGTASAHLGLPGDVLTSATDGFGNAVSFSYLPMTDATVYTRGSGAIFPTIDLQDARPLVRTMQVSPAGGTSHSFTFAYAEARVHVQGRGFLGMGTRTVTDGRNGVYTTETFLQDFPYTGALATSTTKQSSGTTIQSATNTHQVHTLDSSANNQRYLPYRSQTVTQAYEVGGARNGQWITQETETRTVNTLGNTTAVTVATVDKDTGSDEYGQTYTSSVTLGYSEDQANWCLAIPTSRSETRSLPGGSSETRTMASAYDGLYCRMTQETVQPGGGSGLSLVTDLGYDSCGNVNSVSSYPAGQAAAARATTFDYGARCQRPEIITNPLNQGSTVAYDYALGVPTTEADANNLGVTKYYDSFGRPTRVLRSDGTATRYSLAACNAGNGYCGDSSLRYQVVESARDTADVQLWYANRYYDGLGRIRYDQPLTLEGALAVTRTNYDAFGRVSQVSRPYFSGGSVYWVNFSYDLIGRLIGQDAPISESQASGRITAYAYEGREVKVTDPRGFMARYASNVLGRLRKLVDPSPGGTALYAYKPFGELASFTDAAGNVSSWSYNLRGFVTETVDPDAGTWTYVPNAFGELTHVRDAKTASPAWTTQFDYDPLGRPLTRTEAEGTTYFNWGISSAAKNIGRLASISSPGSYSESYTYDSFGRPSQQTVVADGSTYQINRGYSGSTGLPTSLVYPTSVGTYRLTLGYEYQNGLLKRIRDGGTGGTEVFWELTATDAVGRILNESLGNGVITYTEYDQAAGFMTLRQAGVGGGTGLIHAAAQWDLNYNLTQRQDLKQNATEAFYYDGLDRLDYSSLTTPGTGTTTNQDLTYDAIGNILWKKDVCPTAANCYSYHATKRRAVIQAGSTSYGYDANGNMTSRGGSTIGYTSYNLPSVINAGSNSSTLSYGAYRNRYKQVAVTGGVSETTIYVGGILEKVTKSGSTTWRHRVEGPGGLLAIVNCSGASCDPTATTNYVHRDHLGSPELITNSAGTEVVKLSFGAFGERRDRDWHGPVSSSDMTIIGNSTRRGFTEHEHLDSVGLVHMNGRVYDPTLARFLSSDPIEDGLGRPGGFNRYTYVSNRPLTLTDPSGYVSADGWTKHFDYGFLQMWGLKVLKDWALDLEASQGGGPYTGPLPPPRPPTSQPPPTTPPPAGPPAGPKPPGTTPPEQGGRPETEAGNAGTCRLGDMFSQGNAFPIRDGFGPRVHPITGEVGRMHSGIDILTPQGTPWLSPIDGTVALAEFLDNAGGGTVVVQGRGSDSSFRIGGQHLLEIRVTSGQAVNRGDLLALTGGRPGTRGAGGSTGPHLHFYVRRDGEMIDPAPCYERLGQ